MLPRPAVQDKLRLRFRKAADLRLLSHHDLLRCFERMLRRAALPFHNTQGFHPHPRIVFALSLPLGVVGCEEVAELELDEVLPVEEVLDRLRRQAPPGIEILSARRIPLKSTAQVRSLSYRLALPADRVAAVRERVRSLLASDEVWLTRSKPTPGQVPLTGPHSVLPPDEGGPSESPRRTGVGGTGVLPLGKTRVNIRPFLRDLRLVPGDQTDAGSPSTLLEIDLWLTPSGTARPVEMLGLLGLIDLLEAGAILERTRLELHDEGTDE